MNVVTENFTLLLSFWDVPGSNIGRKPGILHENFCGFTQSFQENAMVAMLMQIRA
jgi:hypothetical protein